MEQITKEGTLTMDDYVSLLQKWLGVLSHFFRNTFKAL
jgi:hypothetical protein